jgi:hypothetical protein
MTVPRSEDVIEQDEATAIFAEFASSKDLALRFPADGCYARAHVMVHRLVDQRLLENRRCQQTGAPDTGPVSIHSKGPIYMRGRPLRSTNRGILDGPSPRAAP